MRSITLCWSILFLALTITFNNATAKIRAIDLDSGTVKLTVLYPEAERDQKLELFVAKTPSPINILTDESNKYIAASISPGVYIFSFKVSKRGPMPGTSVTLFSLNSKNVFIEDGLSKDELKLDIFENYFFQPSDVVTITAKKTPEFTPTKSFRNNFNLQFSGSSTLKFKTRYTIDSIQYHRDFPRDYFLSDSTYNLNNGELHDAKRELDYLETFSLKLDHQAYEELRLHALFYNKAFEAVMLRYYFKYQYKNASNNVINRFLKDYNEADLKTWTQFDKGSLKGSSDFWVAELDKYRTIVTVKNKKWIPDSSASILANISDSYVREKLFLLVIKSNLGGFLDFNTYSTKAAKYITSLKGKQELNDALLAQVGKPAFDFSLTNSAGKKVKLSDFKGKVVFVDFWYTGCENCVGYYQDVLSKIEEKFRGDSNYVFISISIDKDADFWKHSIKKGIYTSSSAINLYTNGGGVLNDVIKFYQVYGYPRPIIIDKHQKIFKMDKSLRDEKSLMSALIAAAMN
ncbi:TlpA family protein disulfide reductase [Mucilaginibacter polytrichastri]|nr:TlpA disulfide reductase family protein [Mucilaginibacter polytrichastri]